MTDELFPYYQRELAYVKRLSADFADEYPKVATRLRIGPDSVEDPNVLRLIEAFAFVAGRIRHKIDDEFPELSDALLETLYPHYLCPIPSMAIAQLEIKEDLGTSYLLERGVALETEPVDGEPCRFITRVPVTLWPISVTKASVSGLPADAPPHPRLAEALSIIRITLETKTSDVTMQELGLDRLVFYLSGQTSEALRLYELIMNNALGISLATSSADPDPTILDSQALQPQGFGAADGMLEYPARSFLGYRHLSEFFAFPQRFLFFELSGFDRHVAHQARSSVDIFIYLNEGVTDLERNVTAANFSLGCVPVTNLFRQIAEPIRVTEKQSEYRVVPNARRRKAMETYSIDRVTAMMEGEERVILPFNGFQHDREVGDVYWRATRRFAEFNSPATETYIQLMDLSFDPTEPAKWVLELVTTCFNRDLPSQLPFGGGQPRLSLVESGAPLASIECVTAPTSTLYPQLRKGAVWQLISHLNLNHLSLAFDREGTAALREILSLYDVKNAPESRMLIQGVTLTGVQPVTRRSPSAGANAVVNGLEIEVELDPQRFAGSNVFLFATVLERFFALYVSINSFSQLVVKLKGREGIWRRWPPRAGTQQLL